MATKLLRLVNDRKKHDQDGGVRKVRDVETEEMMEELQGRIRELEKQNDAFRNKVSKGLVASFVGMQLLDLPVGL